jgi:2-keto-4-pentenoate hydratase
MPDLRKLARKQLADYDAHDPGRAFDGHPPVESEADAYALQMEVAKLRILRGEQLAGYKIGCVSEVIKNQLGIDRSLFGHVWCSELHLSEAELDPTVYANLAIEGEFAVRLAADIPDPQWLQAHKRKALAAIFPVIELHNYVLRSTHTALELIANSGIHAGAVLPPEENSLTDPDSLLDEPISVYKNGENVGDCLGGAIPGGPYASLCELAGNLALHGIYLQQGQVVLTGTALPLYPVKGGDRIQVRTRNFGTVSTTVRAVPRG